MNPWSCKNVLWDSKTVQHTKEVFYRACKADYEELEQKWFKNQAARLAETLNEGDACPVCGSEHHPVKSHEQIEEAVSKEQLENEKKRLSEAENQYRTAIINSQNAEQQLDEKSKEMVRLHIDVADNNLHELKKKLEIEVSNLRIDRKNLAELKVQSKEQEAITAQAVATNSELERKLYERKSTHHTEAAVLEMTVQAIPEDVRILSVLQERISEAEQKKIELDHAWERVQKIS